MLPAGCAILVQKTEPVAFQSRSTKKRIMLRVPILMITVTRMLVMDFVMQLESQKYQERLKKITLLQRLLYFRKTRNSNKYSNITLYLSVALVLLSGCGLNTRKGLEASKIILEKSKYDEYLINRSNGIHDLLGYTPKDSSKGIVLVHGFYPPNWPKKGFEWTKALKSMTKTQYPVWWFRHEWNDCPEENSRLLALALDSLKNNIEGLKLVYVIGHSNGGLIVADLAEKWDSNLHLSAHSIASGLNHYRDRLKSCEVQGKKEYVFGENVEYLQWRTSKEIDGIFKNLDYDPQEVELKNGNYVLLPKVWNGDRLGHNLSIQLVMEELINEINFFSS